MIKSIKLPNLRNGEYIQLMTDILMVLAQNNPAALGVDESYQHLKTLVGKIEMLFREAKGSSLTSELMELDTRRDRALNGMTIIINGYTYCADADLKSHALALQNHLAAFGTGIARENLNAQTAILRKLLTDWNENEGLSTALTALHLDKWKDELAAANNLFTERYMARLEEAVTATPGNIKDLRTQTNETWFALRDRLNAWLTLENGAEPFGSVVNIINSVMEGYRGVVRGRGKEKEDTGEN
jgi:hypothetical protein